MHPLGAVLGLPLGFEIGPELLVFLGVFVGEDEVTGAQAVSEGVEAHGGLGLGSVGTGRVLCVLPVGFLLFIGNYHVDFPLLGWWGMQRTNLLSKLVTENRLILCRTVLLYYSYLTK